jgi:hypothetical protein
MLSLFILYAKLLRVSETGETKIKPVGWEKYAKLHYFKPTAKKKTKKIC